MNRFLSIVVTLATVLGLYADMVPAYVETQTQSLRTQACEAERVLWIEEDAAIKAAGGEEIRKQLSDDPAEIERNLALIQRLWELGDKVREAFRKERLAVARLYFLAVDEIAEESCAGDRWRPLAIREPILHMEFILKGIDRVEINKAGIDRGVLRNKLLAGLRELFSEGRQKSDFGLMSHAIYKAVEWEGLLDELLLSFGLDTLALPGRTDDEEGKLRRALEVLFVKHLRIQPITWPAEKDKAGEDILGFVTDGRDLAKLALRLLMERRRDNDETSY